ncbi:cyclin-dependent kinase 5 activator 1-like [Sinocyclocheilus rhinocerous]|uniref:Cyclin-dependent kinase 5 activator n=1 Tax=Sinocyclocheilus rhinocerous TaxID=307959 RepID=A0A673N8D9_9TELE|nr:PREDICTED: cyclin-dependent kinase 5 activator 1-like [Sinocyclocheilus rhinocerous]
MGTVLSLSPFATKGTILQDVGDEANGKIEKSLKKQSVIVSTLTFKRLVTASGKKKSAKKVSPNPLPLPASSDSQVEHLNQENFRKSQQSEKKTKNGPLAVPIPAVPPHLDQDQDQFTSAAKQLVSVQKQPSSRSLISPRRVIVQASTGELLRCLGEFLYKRCCKVKELTANEVILWFRNVDRTLLLQGWQDHGFITPASLVFVYLLIRETVTDDVDNPRELQGTFLTCLYLAYSYIGNEISYPLKPFMVDTNKDVFWERSLDVIDKLSGKMLQINIDPHFFTEVFQDLKNEGDYKKDGSELDR